MDWTPEEDGSWQYP